MPNTNGVNLRRLDALFAEKVLGKGPKPRTRERWVADFWARVDTSGGDDACWPWTGATNPMGYGNVCFRQLNLRSHRVVADLCGLEGDGDLVCHRCNNRLCCNPAHLYRGDESDNFRDCLNAHRHPKQKLTMPQLLAIRRAKAAGMLRTKDLAVRFGVSRSTIQRAANWTTYEWI